MPAIRSLAAAAAVTLAAPLALPAAAQEMTAEEVKRLALEAILENPEIVMEAVDILREREAEAAAAQQAEALAGNAERLTRDPNAPVLGNPEGDVTVVEFFDYNCPYCRRAGEAMKELIAADEGVRVLYREWPILGDGSVVASRAALAAREQGMYEALHWAFMDAPGRLDEASVMEIAEGIGLDVERLRADMEAPEVDAHIDASMALAEEIGFSGTPSFVIGEMPVPGLVPLEELQRLVDEAREG